MILQRWQVKNIFRKIYNASDRFRTSNKSKLQSNHSRNFPPVGFLIDSQKLQLEEVLGVRIARVELFEQALIHRSFLPLLSNQAVQSNERLEFLGDAILGMVIADYLFFKHSSVLEGELTNMRSWLVNKNTLAICAKTLKLDEFLKMSYSAERSLKAGSDSILADSLEAIIAAIYLDSGIDKARGFILNLLLPIMMGNSVMVDKNFKSILLEQVQGQGKPSPSYSVVEECGPDHNKLFVVEVIVEDQVVGQGKGKSKKIAEQDAAKDALGKSNYSNK